MKKVLSGPALDFVINQIKMAGYRKRGQRCAGKIKPLSLTLYHQSPKCYKMLRKIFALPSVSTLKRFMQKLDIRVRPGFPACIFDALKTKVKQMPEAQKLCTLVFDEMSIKEGLTYDVVRDTIEGFENAGEIGVQTKYAANHAGVFMVRGIIGRWKQPVGYFLTSGPMKAYDLQGLVVTCIQKLQSIGLHVKLFVCDQGSNNRSMLQKLGVSITKVRCQSQKLGVSITKVRCVNHKAIFRMQWAVNSCHVRSTTSHQKY